ARLQERIRAMQDAQRRFPLLRAELAVAPVFAQALAASDRLEAERARCQEAYRRESEELWRSRRRGYEGTRAFNLQYMTLGWKRHERERQFRDEELPILGLVDEPLRYHELRAALERLREETLVPEPSGACEPAAS
ncbi:MAG: hypothetical protein HUK26_09985, partial [Duodenibacillus sp.]|nr:hypothetical protein [Duodenibacillus sp.]